MKLGKNVEQVNGNNILDESRPGGEDGGCALSQARIGSGKVVALLEILRAYVGAYVEGDHALGLISSAIVMGQQSGQDVRRDGLLIGRLNDHLNRLLAYCDSLPMTAHSIRDLLATLKMPEVMEKWSEPEMALLSSIAEIQSRLRDELSLIVFFRLPLEKKPFFDAPTEGWEQVIDRFPDTVSDIEEAGKCFALSRYPAAVFHTLLIVEAGIIALGDYIGVTDPKRGWDATTRLLKVLVDGGHAKLPQKLSAQFGFLEQVDTAVQSMKHAWRNKVNHVDGKLIVMRPEFAPDVAHEIMTASRGFMRRLATELPK